jgi:hypothetical protein
MPDSNPDPILKLEPKLGYKKNFGSITLTASNFKVTFFFFGIRIFNFIPSGKGLFDMTMYVVSPYYVYISSCM